MKRATIGMFAVAILAMATVAFAQKPDFSGTWTLDPEASGMAAGGGRGMGAGPMTVKQTADTLTTETTRGENKVTMTYKLDGTESTNTGMGRGGAPTESKSTVKWDGAKLVITTKAGENESTQTWSIDGGNLVIEGTGGRGPTKRIYKKTT